MTMKKTILFLLAVALTTVACQKVEVAVQNSSVWTLTVPAERVTTATRGLETGDGDEAGTTILKSVWKADEEVKVYLDGNCIGTLFATPDNTDSHKATLSGEITTSGITDGVTMLTLFTPRELWDYTGQNGKLLVSDDPVGSIEKKYHYTMAANVLVTAVAGSNITTQNALFTNQQSIYRVSFRYKDGDIKTPITTQSVTVSAAGGHLVRSETPGGAPTEGDISVTLGTATAEPFFVALRNGDETNSETLTFTVVDDAGITYRGTKTIPSEYKPNGTFVSIKNASLDTRLELDLSTTEVSTAL